MADNKGRSGAYPDFDFLSPLHEFEMENCKQTKAESSPKEDGKLQKAESYTEGSTVPFPKCR